MEDSGVGSGGCVVHVDVYGKWVILSVADMIRLACMQKLWSL